MPICRPPMPRYKRLPHDLLVTFRTDAIERSFAGLDGHVRRDINTLQKNFERIVVTVDWWVFEQEMETQITIREIVEDQSKLI